MNTVDISGVIEHTNLKPDATMLTITKLCQQAAEHSFHGVCVNPYYVKHAKKMLKQTGIKVITVVGFPLGSNDTLVKCVEASAAVANGADEIDMVMNIAAFKNGEHDFIKREIQNVIQAIPENIVLKVIIETGLLSQDEIIKATRIVEDAGADFIKTSTGFNEGAGVEDVKLIKDCIVGKMKIKAAGGIRSRQQAMELIKAGASRIGCSRSLELL